MPIITFLSIPQDEKLKVLVDKFGERWDVVAGLVGAGKTDVQCQHRWHKVVNPELVKGPWTKEVRANSTFADCLTEVSISRRPSVFILDSSTM
jgi:hypothetical protein